MESYVLALLLFLGSVSSNVMELTFTESFPAPFLRDTSKPLQASKVLSLQPPRYFFSQTSLSFLDQSSDRDLSSLPVSQQLMELFWLQICEI